nr:tetratricopeptide repeat protein [Nostoc sp. CreGUA01]
MFNLFQPIVEFYNNNKEFINNLLSGAFPAIAGVFWWLVWRRRQRRISEKTFAFEVIKPKSPDLMQRILGGDDDDPLADRNIFYQQRVANRHIRNELKRQIEERRYILILGRTGLGKTREAAELAKHLNQEGWTVLYLKCCYIYDAVDLLQQFDIPLYRFTVEPTARMLAAKNFWQQLWYYWQIRKATNYLISAERILEPRDGQIKAKPKQVEAGEYTLPFTKLILQLAEKHQEIPTSLLSFSWNLINSKRYQDALRCLNKALTFTPDSSDIWFAKGYALVDLGRLEEAIASYDQATKIKPDLHEAWNNRGIALFNLGR